MSEEHRLPEISRLNGGEIRRLRKEKFPDHTIEEFAKELGVAKLTVIRWETKGSAQTYTSLAKRLAKKLAVQFDQITL